MKSREATEIPIYAAMKVEGKMEPTNSYIDTHTCSLICCLYSILWWWHNFLKLLVQRSEFLLDIKGLILSYTYVALAKKQ